MTGMRERTARAHGHLVKAGAYRRIAVQLDEADFLRLRQRALDEGRSLSDAAARIIAAALSPVAASKRAVA
jgi:hypothetical protein